MYVIRTWLFSNLSSVDMVTCDSRTPEKFETCEKLITSYEDSAQRQMTDEYIERTVESSIPGGINVQQRGHSLMSDKLPTHSPILQGWVIFKRCLTNAFR